MENNKIMEPSVKGQWHERLPSPTALSSMAAAYQFKQYAANNHTSPDAV
jgi:hypothetical protein